MFRHKSIAIILSMMLVFTMIPSISFGDEISTIENQQNNLVSEEDNETPNDKTLPSKEDEIEKENAKDSVLLIALYLVNKSFVTQSNQFQIMIVQL